MLASSERNNNVSVTDAADLVYRVEQDGFAIVPSCLNEEVIQSLTAYLCEGSHAKRNLLALPTVRELAASAAIRNLAEAVLGKHCFAVKGTFFNKTQESNWKVAWHQDLTIMVRERRGVAGFGPWTTKEGIVHVQPTADILSRILAIRLHLDESGPDNGPLRVIPRSHKHDRLVGTGFELPKGRQRRLLHRTSGRCFAYASTAAPCVVRLPHPEAQKGDSPRILWRRITVRAGMV